ncbi:MAG: HlyC/CorC family transporter, partial [Acidobacteria bacterium]|nr:HlyC/CorC family transporter [Acidobacteriota bacterium]
LLARAIRFGDKTAADALVPRVDMVSVPASGTVADVAELAIRTGHSRFPVVGEGSDDVVGVAYAMDVLAVPAAERGRVPVHSIATEPTYIPEGRDLESLLAEMRSDGVQLAVVLDEYGGVAGILTVEDLLEEIVGDIEDEHDPAPSLTVALPRGTVVIEGALHGDEVEELTGFEMPAGPYETLAGYLLARLGHIPVPGERVAADGWVFEVLGMDRRRIDRVLVTVPASP